MRWLFYENWQISDFATNIRRCQRKGTYGVSGYNCLYHTASGCSARRSTRTVPSPTTSLACRMRGLMHPAAVMQGFSHWHNTALSAFCMASCKCHRDFGVDVGICATGRRDLCTPDVHLVHVAHNRMTIRHTNCWAHQHGFITVPCFSYHEIP